MKKCEKTRKLLDSFLVLCYNILMFGEPNRSGCGAVGSALPWGGRGRKFKSCHSDQNKAVGHLPNGFIFISAMCLEVAVEITPCAAGSEGGRGFPKASLPRFGGSTVVCRKFKSCHSDQIKTSGVCPTALLLFWGNQVGADVNFVF